MGWSGSCITCVFQQKPTSTIVGTTAAPFCFTVRPFQALRLLRPAQLKTSVM